MNSLWALFIFFCFLLVNCDKSSFDPEPEPQSPDPAPSEPIPSPTPQPSSEPQPSTPEPPTPEPPTPEPPKPEPSPTPQPEVPPTPEPVPTPIPEPVPTPTPSPKAPPPQPNIPPQPSPVPAPLPVPVPVPTPQPSAPQPSHPEPQPSSEPEPHPEPESPKPAPGSIAAYVVLVRNLTNDQIENYTKNMECEITITGADWPELTDLDATLAEGHYNLTSYNHSQTIEHCNDVFSKALKFLADIPDTIIVETNITNGTTGIDWSAEVTLSLADEPNTKQTVVLYIIIGVITAVALIVTIVLIVSLNKGKRDDGYGPVVDEVDDEKYKDPY